MECRFPNTRKENNETIKIESEEVFRKDNL